MRYAIFSDVHGNLEALEAVLARYEDLGVHEYVFLGDAVGYGANRDVVCTVIRALAKRAILGNHDAAVCGKMDYEDYYEAARHALEWCRHQVKPDNVAWLKQLPYKLRADDVEFSHGAPEAPELFDYLFASEQVGEMARAYPDLAPVTFIGHSHLTIAFRVTGTEATPVYGPEIHCEPGAKYVITVGSVGQPRDRDPRACCGLYDTETRLFNYHRVPYDVLKARQKILDAGLAQVFADRLLVGM